MGGPGAVQHGKIHDVGDEKNHTHKRVVNIMHVSPSGSDTIGDGTHYNPFLTANVAITKAVALGWTHVSIYFDPTGASYTVTIPDGLEVSLCALEALYAQSASIDEIIVGNGCYLSMDNLYVVVIKEAAGITFSEILIEECVVERITDSVGGLPAKLDLTISNMFGDSVTRTDLDGAFDTRGTTIDTSTGKIYTYGGLDSKGNKITSVGKATANGDAVRFEEFSALESGYSRRTAVIDYVDCTAAPPTEVTDDRYILDFTVGSVHADWDGASKGDIVQFNGSVWESTTPIEGYVAYVDAENQDRLYVDDGSPDWEARPAYAAHLLGGVYHSADIIANLNAKISDATLEDKTVLESTMDTKDTAAIGVHAALPNVHHTPPTTLPSTVIQDSDATEFTTTNTTFTQAKRFSKTTLAKKYRVDMFCEIYQSDRDKMVVVQGQIDDTTHVFQCWEIPDQNEAKDIPMCAAGTIIVTLTAASHNFDFDIKQQRGGTAKARNFRLIIMEVVE